MIVKQNKTKLRLENQDISEMSADKTDERMEIVSTSVWDISKIFVIYIRISAVGGLVMFICRQGRGVFHCQDVLSIARPGYGRSGCWEGLGRQGFVGLLSKPCFPFHFLLMGLTDLISCLRMKDNLAASPLTSVGEYFTSMSHSDFS